MNNITTTTALAEQANRHHAEAQNKARQAVEHALASGRALSEAKAQLPHGGWADWLDAHFDGSARTARSYMNAASRFDALPEAKRQHVANLPSLRQALEVMADDEPKAKRETKGVEPAVPSWLPKTPRTMATWLAREPQDEDDFPASVRVQRSLDNPDYWHVFGVTEDDVCFFTERPILGNRVGMFFEHTGVGEILQKPETAAWQYEDVGYDFIKKVLIESIVSGGGQ